MPVPNDRKYSTTHEWFKTEGSVVTVGITQFAADSLTDITYVDLPKPGKAVTAGESFGVVESVKATSDVYSPVNGTVKEANAKLADSPELVNTNPFGAGWFIKLEVKDAAPLTKLLDGPAYEKTLDDQH